MNLVDSHDTPRLLTIANGDTAGIKLVLTLLFSFPGAPCLYYGDEVGMPGGHDPDCRRGMEWDEELWHRGILQHVKACTALRHRSEALRRGDFSVLTVAHGAIVLARQAGAETVVVVVNPGEQAVSLDFPAPAGRLVRQELGLAGEPDLQLEAVAGGRLALEGLPARTAQMWVLHRE